MMLSTLAHAALMVSVMAVHVTAQSDAWHFDIVKKLMTARLDPIIDPQQLSNHAHRILGGSNFAAGYNFNASRDSDCSTVYTQHDKSNYWTAQMYWVNNDANTVKQDTTYTPLPANHRFYYFLTRNSPDVPVSPFPEGLRVLVGNKDAKRIEDTGIPDDAWTYTCQKSLTDLSQNTEARSWNDFDFYCPEVKLDLKFPSCWDGVNLYTDDNSHMTYPSQLLYGSCPLSHPIRLPAIMFEVTWLVWKVTDNVPPKNRLIQSNGDTSAWGTHVDFTNGWNTEILHKALNDPKCVNLGHSIPATECPSLEINYDTGKAAAEACKPMRGFLGEEGEEDLIPIKKLPGCNLPWFSGEKPACTEAASSPDFTNFLGIETQSYTATTADTLKVAKANRLSETVDEWQDVGCITDKAYDYEAAHTTMWHNWKTMTPKACQDWCGSIGAPYASVQRGYQCYCSASLDLAGTAYSADKCNTKCSGDNSQTCGADGIMQTWYKPTVKAQQPSASDKSYMGCFVDRTISGVRNPDYADVDGCRAYCGDQSKKYFALSNSRYCHCSDEVAKPQGWESRVPEAECNSKCQGNESQTCGGNQEGIMFQSVFLVDGEVQVEASEAVVAVTSSSSAAATAPSPTTSSSVKAPSGLITSDSPVVTEVAKEGSDAGPNELVSSPRPTEAPQQEQGVKDVILDDDAAITSTQSGSPRGRPTTSFKAHKVCRFKSDTTLTRKRGFGHAYRRHRAKRML